MNIPFPGAPPAKAPLVTLSTDGNRLLLDSKPIRIKGAARQTLEQWVAGQGLSPDDIAHMAAKHFNTIRVAMDATFWNDSEPETVPGSYKQTIDAIIFYATLNKMLVILDYHWYNPTVQQQNMAPYDPPKDSKGGNTIKFWTSVAQKYKGFGNVMFELYNEPHDIVPDVWLHGDAAWIGMQAMYDAVRSTGAKNVVVVNGLDWAYYLGFLSDTKKMCGGTDCFLKDKSQGNGYAYNIMYSSHPYTICSGDPCERGTNTHHYKGEKGYTVNGQPADFDTNYAGVVIRYPIIWTEFSDNQANNYNSSTLSWPDGLRAMLTYANSNKYTTSFHYTAFAWQIQPDKPSYPVIIAGSWATPSFAFSGLYIESDLRASPGTDLSKFKW